MIRYSELKKMTARDLQIELQKILFEIGELSFLLETGQDKASHKLSKLKKYRARIRTAQNQLKKAEERMQS